MDIFRGVIYTGEILKSEAEKKTLQSTITNASKSPGLRFVMKFKVFPLENVQNTLLSLSAQIIAFSFFKCTLSIVGS